MEEVLHVLAYFGVWFANVVIFEIIAVLVWAPSTMLVELKLPLAEEKITKISYILRIVVFVLFAGAAIGCCFGWPRIIPFPTFNS